MVQTPAPEQAETAAAILDAAEPLFARQGFAATTIKQIGAAAGVNPALIYYWFGSKDDLYRELLRRLFGTLVTRGGERLAAVQSPAEAIRIIIQLQSQTMQAHPSLPRLLARELADHGATHVREGVASLSATVFARLCKMIEEGQRAGLFRTDMDARFAAVSVVSLIPYFHIAKPAVAILLGVDEEPTAEQMDAYAAHAADFVLAALSVKGGGG
jgi:TetR/AcrR family transcriptional regulator